MATPNPLAIYDLAAKVLGCVCEQMDTIADDTYPGCPCRVYVAPGPPAFDNCCDWRCDGQSHGQLTVHVEDVYPTTNFPVRAQAIHPCAPQVMVAQLLIVAIRCAPTIDEAGADPEPAEIEATSRIVYTDLWAVQQALTCCVPRTITRKRHRRVVVANTTNLPTSGGCAGVSVRALIEAGQVCACPPEETS